MNRHLLHSAGDLFTSGIRKQHMLNKGINFPLQKWFGDIAHQWLFQSVLHFVSPRPAGHEFDVDLKNVDEEEMVTQIEAAATVSDQDSLREMGSWEIATRRSSFLLATANYVVAYSPGRIGCSSSALFSYPWLVADVIHAGISDSLTNKENNMNYERILLIEI